MKIIKKKKPTKIPQKNTMKEKLIFKNKVKLKMKKMCVNYLGSWGIFSDNRKCFS